jgi:dolichol-phosphate mannosyltransferase
MADDKRLLSMVVPVLNEQEVLPTTFAELTRVLESLGRPFEVLVVDNGSTDATPEVAAGLCDRDPRWRYMRLSRNFGYQNSITAGMTAAGGEAVMVIDADLQDPPELIADFVAKWEEGYDVVYGVRTKRVGESPLRVIPTMLAMRLITWLSDDFKLPAHSGDFRLISRRARDAFARLPESNRYVRGMIHWLGYRQVGIPYTRRGRVGGTSKVNWVHLIGFTWNAVINFSVRPVRAFGLLGLAVLALTAVLAVVPGLALTTALLLLNLGVLSLGIGVVGEYVARVHVESKRRPLWLVDYTVNMPDGALEARPEPRGRSAAA